MIVDLLKRSTPDDRIAECEPLAQKVREQIMTWVEAGDISLREAHDITKSLCFAFTLLIETGDRSGMTEFLEPSLQNP